MLHDTWVPDGQGAVHPDVHTRSGTADPFSRILLSTTLIVVSCLVIALATGLLGVPLSRTTPEPNPVTGSSVTDQVVAYALGWLGPAEDPPIVLPNGLRVKTSNYRGVRIDGTVYYYDLSPQPSYDPLTRHEVTSQQINVVAIRGNYPNRVMIYTIPATPTPVAWPVSSGG